MSEIAHGNFVYRPEAFEPVRAKLDQMQSLIESGHTLSWKGMVSVERSTILPGEPARYSVRCCYDKSKDMVTESLSMAAIHYYFCTEEYRPP